MPQPIQWFYTWNSKDEVFHHILKSCFEDADDYFNLHEEKIQPSDNRFTAAATFLETQPENQLVMISDANIIVDNTLKLYEYLQLFAEYDLVAMKDDSSPTTITTDILLVRNTQKVRDYMKNHLLLKDLHYTYFQSPIFCNSQLNILEIMKSRVVHLTSFHKEETEELYDKLLIASLLVDITPLEPIIPYDIWNRIIDEHVEFNTGLPIMFFNHKSKSWQTNILLKGSQT